MNHPILSRLKVFRLYALLWAVVVLIHSVVLWNFYNIEPIAALMDGFVFNFFLFVFGIEIWYPVFYIDIKKGLIKGITQHIFAGAILIWLWQFLSQTVLSFFLDDRLFSILYTNESLTVRVVLGGLMFLVFTLVYYMLIFFDNIQQKEKEQETMQRLLRETELKALKAQLNPHFLFNSLNSISSLTITDSDGARDMINKLSDFMRYSLKKNENAFLPLREEMKNMARYLEIEKVRFGDRLNCVVENCNECSDLKIPVLLLQPLYENAIKHGVYESIEPVTIRTFCKVVDGELEISIINNFDPEGIVHKGEGVGLENVKSRLYYLFNRQDLVEVNIENNFFEVVVRIPQLIEK